jgi:nucleoside-diphosphate-sugar epimerase
MLNLSGVESLLITGANGFVGRSLLGQISKLSPSNLPKKIVLVSRSGLNFELPKNLEACSTQVVQDLTSEWVFQEPVSHLINLAADGSKDPYSEEANQTFLSIVQNLISWVSKMESRPEVFHASSGACYGRIPLEEEAPATRVKSDFALVRIQAENLLKKAANESNFDLTIARLFTFSGILLLSKDQYAITDFVKNGVQGRDIYVKGDARTLRSYLHQDAMANWILKSLVMENSGTTLQIGSDTAVTIGELAEFVAEKTGVQVQYSQAPASGDIYLPNNLETRTKLGVEEGLCWQKAVEEMIAALRTDNHD